VPWFVTGLLVVAIGAWLMADWLAGIEWLGGAVARMPVATWAPAIGVVLAASGLGGADDDLERSVPARWRLLRLVHASVVALLVAGSLALTGLWESRTFGAFELVRNAAGYVGLLAVGAVVLGARLAWAPLIGYVTLVYSTQPVPPRLETAWWTWPVQPWSVTAAASVAGGLLLAGSAAYVRFGSRPVRHADAV
jgi:uncharacterized membrane protein YedE/YeeE